MKEYSVCDYCGAKIRDSKEAWIIIPADCFRGEACYSFCEFKCMTNKLKNGLEL